MVEDTESEVVEASVEIMMIDTSKRRGASQPATKKRAASIPKVGSKRLRKTSKKEEGDEDEQSEADEDNSEGPVKKRKVGAGKAKAEKKPVVKKGPKMPTEFKKGKWNPNVELVKIEKYKEDPSNEPFIECCIRCNNRNPIRAANTNNDKLLQACIQAKDKISLLTAYWSCDLSLSTLTLILMLNEHQLMETLLHPKLHVPQHSTYEQERNVFF